MKTPWLLALLGSFSLHAMDIKPLSDHLYRYTLVGDFAPYGKVPTNGVIYLEGNKALLVDTGWDLAQGRELLNWIQAKGIKDVDVVLTHSHLDRRGGMGVFLDAGLPVWAHESTAALLKEPRLTVWSGSQLKLGPAELYYPGAGHSPDNLVVWFAGQSVLFGGCLVKDEEAESLGNLEDADLGHWPVAITALEQRFGQAKVVIPGHGPSLGPGALAHTLSLLKKP